VSALLSSAIFAMFYSTTLYQQQVLGYSALRTGLAYIPLGLSILASASAGPAVVSRIGVRFTTAAGSLVAFGGMLLLAGLPVSGHLLTNLIGPEVIVGLGAGLVLIPTSVAAMSGVPAERGGIASALLNVSRQLGGALGLAVISTVVTTQAARAVTGGDAAAAALTSGFRGGFAVSAGLMVATVVTALLFLREDGRGASVNMIELQTAGAS
jgi:hypothetical protein